MPVGLYKPVFEPLMVRVGATLPCALVAYSVTVELPSLATHMDVPLMAMPKGPFSPVFEPAMVWSGAALPFALAAYTVTLVLAKL
jgi:hypothetical protein